MRGGGAQCSLFQGQIKRMGIFTLEHSQAAYRADFILYGGAVAALVAATLAVAPEHHAAHSAGLALAGLGLWSAIEYGLHRFVLHGVACDPPLACRLCLAQAAPPLARAAPSRR